MMEKFEIKDRLCAYLSSIDLSVNKLEEMCDFSSRYINNSNFKLPRRKIDVILAVLPELNGEWLLSGTGEMTKERTETQRQDASQLPLFRKGVLDRIEQLFENEGLSVAEYEASRKLLPRGTFERCRKRGGIDEIWSWIKAIVKEYPDYSPSWIIYGEGEMTRKDSRVVPNYEIAEFFNPPIIARKPVENLENIFPRADFVGRITHIPSCEIPPAFKQSDILAFKQIKLEDLSSQLLLTSSHHLIVLTNGTVWIRRVKSSANKLSIISIDEKELIEVEKSDLQGLYEIVGYIRHL